MAELSIWEKETFFAAQDIVIVGSGFTGLWSALHLKLANPQLKITILERGLIPTGASTRNAGFSCFGSPSELIADAERMGEAPMWKLVAQRYKGLQQIRNIFTDNEIDYNASGGYECFSGNDASWQACLEKLEWLNKNLEAITGFEDVFKKKDEMISSFGFAGFDHLVENRLEGGLHPGKLIRALLAKVQLLGVQVLTGFEPTNYVETDTNILVNTTQGIAFSTTQLLLCTNAFTKTLLPGIDIIPNRGQVLLTAPIKNLRFKGTFHFDQGYYYFRNLNGRLLLGGARNVAFADEKTTTMESTEVVQTELERFIRRHLLPGTDFEITDRWTGIMGMGTEKTPIVQPVGKNVFCCVRMSGMGVALAPVVAQEIADLMIQQSTT